MVTLTIDGRTVSVPEGTTILEAAQTLRISIPTLCYLKDINEIGACRICMVEVEGYAPAGALLRQRCQRGHGGLHQLTPCPGGPPSQSAAAAEPARDEMHQVHPQRQLQAPAADQRL